MVFENKNSHWIDAYTSKFEESFKSINLLDKKKEYWRFASPSIWHDKLPIKKFGQHYHSDNRQFLNNKIQYAIRSVKFVWLSFLIYIVFSGFYILSQYSSV